MCTVLFSYKATPGYRLILAANRDEFLDRPTAPLSWWGSDRRILAGQDLRAGGTWLGASRDGRFSILTNYREVPQRPEKSESRGEIVAGYLEADRGDGYLELLSRRSERYRGFNLLAGGAEELYYFSNRKKGMTELLPGIYGLSNHLLDTPWPKVVRGKALFQRVLDRQNFCEDDLFAVLEDTRRPPDAELPQTGIGIEWERLLSAIHIQGKNYATRTSALLTIDESGLVRFRERTYGYGEADRCGEVEERYRI